MSKTVHIAAAKNYKEAGDYDKMLVEMKEMYYLNEPFTEEEMGLWLEAYQKVITMRSVCWHLFNPMATGDTIDAQSHRVTCDSIVNDLRFFCSEAVTCLDKLLREAPSRDHEVLYHKHKGDFYRFMVDIPTGATREEYLENSSAAYQAATDVAKTHLLPTHLYRLSLAITFSVFQHDLLNSTADACETAKATIDAINGEFQESSRLLEELKRLHREWSSELTGELGLSSTLNAFNQLAI